MALVPRTRPRLTGAWQGKSAGNRSIHSYQRVVSGRPESARDCRCVGNILWCGHTSLGLVFRQRVTKPQSGPTSREPPPHSLGGWRRVARSRVFWARESENGAGLRPGKVTDDCGGTGERYYSTNACRPNSMHFPNSSRRGSQCPIRRRAMCRAGEHTVYRSGYPGSIRMVTMRRLGQSSVLKRML